MMKIIMVVMILMIRKKTQDYDNDEADDADDADADDADADADDADDADAAYKGPEILYPLQQSWEGQEIENQESLQKIVYNPHQQRVRIYQISKVVKNIKNSEKTQINPSPRTGITWDNKI